MKNMKNMKKMLGFLFIMGALSSCDLERQYITFNTKEKVDKEYELFHNMGIGLYGNLPTPLDGQIYFDSPASDESNDVWIGASQSVNNGSWNEYSWDGQEFQSLYNSIGRINDFLNPIAEIDLDAWKLSPLESDQLKYTTYKYEIANLKREARFLRAFFYFELVKRYGGVPLIKEPLTTSTDFSGIKRNTLNECFQFIVDELDSTTQDEVNCLPLAYDEINSGRATKGAALALKSRVTLYMASDLYNSLDQWAPGYEHPELVSLIGKDRKTLWKNAADAAKKVIDLGVYTPASDYNIIGKSFTNSELIFVRRMMGQSNNFEWENCPRGYLTARGRLNPSQNLVDAYEMKNGSKFNWATNGEDPYSNRDPRLDMTVYHNESVFQNTQLDISVGGANGAGPTLDHTTGTGYYIKKFIDSGLDLSQNKSSYHTWCFFRISEIYLNYAEALNEYDPGNPDILTYVNKTRQRTGVNMPTIKETDQVAARERIRTERQIELAFEGHRFWDLRRWMTAVDVLNKPLRGVNISYEDYTYQYTLVETEPRIFLPKMYFHPFPKSLLVTEGVDWPQNPLWEK